MLLTWVENPEDVRRIADDKLLGEIPAIAVGPLLRRDRQARSRWPSPTRRRCRSRTSSRHVPARGRRGGRRVVTSTPVLEHDRVDRPSPAPRRLRHARRHRRDPGRGGGRRVALSVLVGARAVPLAASVDASHPLHGDRRGARRPHPARPRGRRGARPGRRGACRGSPATRWPTRASSASTPAPASRWSLAISVVRGLGPAAASSGSPSRGPRPPGAGARRRLRRSRRRHADEARHRRRRADRGASAAGRPACC